ncbi:hypothetical protein SAMN05216316_1365 [Nitrosovibrio sp. Nv6]|nr:hypothetical protein SAMN05216316_1365 [Nitrosovibrio sp. Nv6]
MKIGRASEIASSVVSVYDRGIKGRPGLCAAGIIPATVSKPIAALAFSVTLGRPLQILMDL